MSLRLSEPVSLGGLRLQNRIVMPAIGTGYADKQGFVTPRLLNHYIELAKGGAGLIIIEVTAVSPAGKMFPTQVSICKDDFIPGLRQLAAAVKEASRVKCVLQLHHAGRRAPPQANNGAQAVAPSAIAPWGGQMPHELTLEEIAGLIEAFADGAGRAQQAGFDGLELHCANNYLIQQFFSPLTNKRTDQYGGDLESRAKFALDILRRIRQKVGKDYPVLVKICGDEFLKGGLTLRDSQKIVTMFDGLNISAIEVSAGCKASSEEGYINSMAPFAVLPMALPRGYFLHLAEGVKKATNIPVIALGRLDEPDLAEQVIAEGKADLIAIGRGHLADPFFSIKAFQGRHDDIRPCIACNTCSDSSLDPTANGTMCAVNAQLGKEEEYQIRPADKPKKILVVGGGPAGMEAATVAARRGHKVTLVEKKPYLGGNLIAASAVSFKRQIKRFTDYLSGQVQKSGVNVRLGYEFSEEKLSGFAPDVVILAIGAFPQMPDIPGIDRRNAADAVAILEGKLEAGPKVVVVGGGMIGCEVAVFLAEKGKEVTLVTRRNSDFSMSGGLAPDMEQFTRKWLLFELLPTLPVEVVANRHFKEVVSEGLVARDREGKTRLIEGDTVVFATGMSPNNGLIQKLQGKVPVIYQIGDCVQPRKIINAVHEAAEIARLI